MAKKTPKKTAVYTVGDLVTYESRFTHGRPKGTQGLITKIFRPTEESQAIWQSMLDRVNERLGGKGPMPSDEEFDRVNQLVREAEHTFTSSEGLEEFGLEILWCGEDVAKELGRLRRMDTAERYSELIRHDGESRK